MIRWLRQYWAITKNAFVVCLSDPLYLVLMLSVLGLMALLACVPTYNFGEELRLIRDQSVALIFMGGCVLGVVGAVTTIVRDLERGTISMLMSRPISSVCFVFGKWTGVAGAIIVYQITMTLACLWVTRIAAGGHPGDQHLDNLALGIYAGVIILALLAMAIKHYFLGGWYVWQASVAVCGAMVIGFIVVALLPTEAGGRGIDWKSWQACLMLLFAELVFSAILVPIAVKLRLGVVFVAGFLAFFLGLVSEYVVTQVALLLGSAGIWVSWLGKALMPNWQIFWIADLLAESEAMLAPSYLIVTSVHALIYSVICLVIAALLFNRREFAGHDIS